MPRRLPRFPYAHWIEMIAGGAIACFLIDKLARCPHRGHKHSEDLTCEPKKEPPAEQDGESKD